MTTTAPAVEAVPFDPAGDLPGPGITVVEASAGTGKTHTLTSLLVRYVAMGIPLSSILAVTFTRMATGELRERIRERMVSVHAVLARRVAEAGRGAGSSGAASAGWGAGSSGVAGGGPAAGSPGGEADDAVASLLASCPLDELAARADRLAVALAEFDAATIATIHGFCQLAIGGLGSTGDAAPGTVLLEDPSDLRDEIVEDLYLRERLADPATPITFAEARVAAELAVREPSVELVPPASSGDAGGRLARLAQQARDRVAGRLLEGGFVTYDDLLYRLARTLEDPSRGPLACDRLSERYRVVVVDEFQDTDPVQWRILQRAFGGGRSTLILIGDPKQAIYAFRGADVLAYLEAARLADRRYTLSVNRRTDQGLLDALGALFDPLRFGHPDIPFRPVDAPPGKPPCRLQGAPVDAPLRIRVVGDHQHGVATTKQGLHQKSSLTSWIAADVAADIADLLSSGVEVLPASSGLAAAEVRAAGAEGRSAGSGGGALPAPLKPSGVAVLTRTNRQAMCVRDALVQAGVAAVITGSESVFGSDAAEHWLTLLDGLLEPAPPGRAAAVALSPFIGMTPFEVATAGEERWEEVHGRLQRWSALAATSGIAVLYRSIVAETDMPGRLLRTTGGERILTDLGHVAHLLHVEASDTQTGPAGLRVWLAARRKVAAEEQTAAEDRSRRLESDADAVQILTIHKVKGLEFPVVYCPFLWDAGRPDPTGAVVVHQLNSSGSEERIIDVGCPKGSDPSAEQAHRGRLDLAAAELRGEDLRLMYVALTRACHQLVLWWGHPKDSKKSPLARVLLGRDHATGDVSDLRYEPKTADISAALDAVAARAPGLVSVERPGPIATHAGFGAPHTGAAGEVESAELDTAAFERSLDDSWIRASYSSLTAASHATFRAAPHVMSEPEAPGVSDEPDVAGDSRDEDGDVPTPEVVVASPAPESFAVPSAFQGIPGGREIGTYFHRILEKLDFVVGRDPDELGRVARASAGWAPSELDPALVAAGLGAALTTPLGPLVDGISLSDIGRRDRLDELAFELPVGGGDGASGSLTVTDIAGVLERHLDPSQPLAGYPAKLRDPLLAVPWRGYLTGSLDLVFRRPGPDGRPRWFLADYKTNQLAPPGVPATAWDYRPEGLDAEMQRSHYPLQALIYSVALHRYLRWRQPGYDPETDLGGVLYLFLRGMVGPDAPTEGGVPCGVFSWRVPPALVVELSELFERGAVGEGT